MFKLIIVDDEANIRTGLEKAFDWGKYGFEVAGLAEDGVDALELFEREKPSLVITDIKMPRMDGLELSKVLKSMNPEVHIIILSGYSDFGYAREAIKYGVSHYLLKPVDFDELQTALGTIGGTIERRLEVTQERSQDDKRLRGYFLEKLTKYEYFDGMEYYADRYGIPLANNQYNILLLNTDAYEELVSGMFGGDEARMKSEVFMILEAMAEEEHSVYAFADYRHSFGILFTSLNAYPKDYFQLMAMRILKDLAGFCGESFDIGIGKTVGNYHDIHISYKSAADALGRKAFEPEGHIFMSDMDSGEGDDARLHEMIQYIRGNYAGDLNLKKLSELFHFNQVYMGQLFKSVTGKYFHEFINSIRIENAILLLQDRNISIDEISQRVGYKSNDHFYKSFKKVIGMNPGEYRKRLEAILLKSNDK